MNVEDFGNSCEQLEGLHAQVDRIRVMSDVVTGLPAPEVDVES
jgi:hypothetical protein